MKTMRVSIFCALSVILITVAGCDRAAAKKAEAEADDAAMRRHIQDSVWTDPLPRPAEWPPCECEEDTSAVTVYVAGSMNGRATLWVNGAAQTLGDSVSNAVAVFVSGNDVYVLGVAKPSPDKYRLTTTLWKNGVPQTIDNDSVTIDAKSLFVDGDDVYIAGDMRREGVDGIVAALWKNGVVQFLYDDYSKANSVYVYGGDVYVAGGVSYDHYIQAARWKNGVLVAFGGVGEIQDVFVFKNNVYELGEWERADPENAELMCSGMDINGIGSLDNDGECSTAAAIFVSCADGDVYAVGRLAKDWLKPDESIAVIWRNGVPQTLSDSKRVWGNDIYVDGCGVVYVAGAIDNRAALWKNGTAQILGGDGSFAYSVYVGVGGAKSAKKAIAPAVSAEIGGEA